MASSSWVWFLVVLAVHVVAGATPLSSSNRCYRAIYSFGDSLADTGNSNYDTNHTLSSSQTLALHVPYGETFFHHPTGRWSDGRLIVDFIAEKMGFPLLKPYLGIKSGTIKDWKPTEGVNFAVAGATALDSSFYLEKGISNVVTNYSLRVQLHWFTEELLPSICHSPSAEHMGIPLLKPYLGIKNGKIRDWKPMEEGVNFAVGGATALDPSFFVDKGINDIATNYSLGVQLDWFQHLLPSICNSSSGCKEILGKSLFFVGEIGGNDLNHPLFQYTSVDEIMRTYVPNVINEISSTINKLIDVGAQTLLVPGNFPLGCSFFYLNIYHTTDMGEYDHAGCLKWLNKVAKDYNKKLYAELNRLQVLHPHTNIIYADYYHAAYSLYQSPSLFGFTNSTHDACCVPENVNNNYDSSVRCGDPEVIACDDPSKYISWDGVHLTEAAYKWIAKALLKGHIYVDKEAQLC
ncbi:GDSL esterase/lipase At1g28580 isoform X2 [Arachis hypogaea]|uniref:GDSL esterase/lipase At1g28580 isoform X2 n=1 Tax=Arachis hypogaea TaxID=3818 RepID=UPI003B219680